MAEKPPRSFRLDPACVESIRWYAKQLGLSDAAIIELAVLMLRKNGIPGLAPALNPDLDISTYLADAPAPQQPPLKRKRGRRPAHEERGK